MLDDFPNILHDWAKLFNFSTRTFQYMINSSPQKILMTAGRSYLTLDLARQLHAAGHQIYVAETSKRHISFYSNSVVKSFVIPSPRFDSKLFIESLIKIITEEKIDLFIPIYEEILHISKEKDKFPKFCQIFCHSFNELHELHNKWLFYSKLKSLGFDTPKTSLITSQNDLEKTNFSVPFALKACYSRGSINIKKVYPNKPLPKISIEAHNPWIAQEWLEGDKFCTYSICYNGLIKAHSTYPVKFAIDGNSCLTFEVVEHEAILKWIEKFVSAINFTGQIGFDFIELPNKKLYAIECNPRATSGLHLFENVDRIDRAFLNSTNTVIYPQKGINKQIATGMLLYGWKSSAYPGNNLPLFLKTLLSRKDVVFSLDDIKPFLAVPCAFAAIWMKSKKKHLSLPATFTYDYEWNGDDKS